MSLQAGARLGGYEIVALVGAGGMGEVYRARDGRLGRDVALKILPDALAGADHAARFEREARALAALNHPHIATLFGAEQCDGRQVLVMELVDGDSLADRIGRGPLALDEALRVAIQIAEALEAAHERAIVHRDLKPANVKLTADGSVKVLDFGLAKALSEAAPGGGAGGTPLSMSPTLSLMATQAGIILGTAAYMSPEQAKGLAADHRSDIFSFGVVLYEMLVGRPPFGGETAPDILASVLAREPNFAALPVDLNPRLIELLRRCLAKQPKQRWQAIGDLRAELEVIAASPRAAAAVQPPPAVAPRGWRRALPAIAAAIVASALTGTIVWRARPSPPAPVTRFRLAMSADTGFAMVARQLVGISPDGSRIAYMAPSGLYVQALSESDARIVAGTESAIAESIGTPLFSPDGRFLAFFTRPGPDATLKAVAVTGGVPMSLGRLSGAPFGASWSGDHIFFGGNSRGVFRISATGGSPELIVPPAANEFYQSPQLLPDGDTLLVTVASSSSPSGSGSNWDAARIVAHSLKTHARKVLIDGGTDARYVDTGHLLYAQGGVVFAVRFDPARLEIHGRPVPVIEGVARAAASGSAMFATSSNGTLAYLAGPSQIGTGRWALAWTNPNGASGQVAGLGGGSYETPRISADGRFVAVTTTDHAGTNIMIVSLAEGTSPRRLTFGGRNRLPVWSHDGSRVAFQSDRESDLGVFSQAADGSGIAERLTKPEAGAAHEPSSWSRDGGSLLIEIAKGSERTLWRLSMRDRHLDQLNGIRSTNPINATFSPDGHWIAYGTNDGGADAIFVEPFPQTGAKYQISRGDIGHHPVWSRDGRRLFYIPGPGQLASVAVTTAPSFSFSAPSPAPRSFVYGNAQVNNRNHDIGPDGRALGIVAEGQAPVARPVELNVVLNWAEELKQRVPANTK